MKEDGEPRVIIYIFIAATNFMTLISAYLAAMKTKEVE